MNQLLTRLLEGDWTLLVSLPRNDAELARAALNGGAQGLKVHLNVEHFASGTKFGAFKEEKAALQEIVKVAEEYSASVGVVPGGSPFTTKDEFRELAELGIDYFNSYPTDTPAWTFRQKYLDIMLAAFHGISSDELIALEELGMEICEASIMPQESYGQPLNTLDLARYQDLSQTVSVPFIVPSQKKLTPEDQPLLQSAGARGVLIGAVITGSETASIETTTRTFHDVM